jgi:PPP family 3-phenylpropionic acid transporter
MTEPPRQAAVNLPDRPDEANRRASGAAQFSTDHFAMKLGLFYAAFFFYGGVQLPFFPLWLESKGLDPGAIGVIVAAPMLMRIVSTPIVAHQADRRRAIKATLVIASSVATLGMTAVGLVRGPAAILLTFALSAVAFSPVLSLTDAYAMSGLPARGRAYGPVRLWGSVAFIGGNVGAGLLLHLLAPGSLIWLIVASLALSAAAATMLAPLERPADKVAALAATRSPKALLRNPAFLAVALAASLIQSSHALYYGFSAVQWRAAGLDGTLIGALWGLGVAAEVALFALSGRLPPRLSPAMLLAIGGAGAAVRWAAMAFDPPVAALPALQLLHACSFAATHLGMIAFMTRAAPRELVATGQGLISTSTGVVNAAATLVSGFAYAAVGSRAYLIMTGMALIGFASALYAQRRQD